MEKHERSIYGTTTAEPDPKAGVEVGGGEKPAAKEQAKERERDEDEHGSTSESRHEKRPEGPHADPKNTNHEATPGAGTLPDGDDQDATGG